MPSAVDARSLYQEGRLTEAIAVLEEELRNDPANVPSRMFLFELLCFAGAYDRVRKQLHAVGSTDPDAHMGTSWYREALQGLEQRLEMFRSGTFPESKNAAPVAGTLNGQPFKDLRDANPRIGARLETLVSDRYMWVAFEHLASVRIEAPRQLRDLFWIPAEIEGTDALGGHTGEVLVPALTPTAWEHPDELVRLGRLTEWYEIDSGDTVPVGQKMLLVDGEEFPLLEVRELLFSPPGS